MQLWLDFSAPLKSSSSTTGRQQNARRQSEQLQLSFTFFHPLAEADAKLSPSGSSSKYNISRTREAPLFLRNHDRVRLFLLPNSKVSLDASTSRLTLFPLFPLFQHLDRSSCLLRISRQSIHHLRLPSGQGYAMRSCRK